MKSFAKKYFRFLRHDFLMYIILSNEKRATGCLGMFRVYYIGIILSSDTGIIRDYDKIIRIPIEQLGARIQWKVGGFFSCLS